MMKLAKFVKISLLSFSLLVAACNDDDFSPIYDDIPLIEAGEEARQLLFVYIVADNDLSDYAQFDLTEILQASHEIPNDCFLLAFVDDDKGSRVLRYFNNNGVGDYETVYNFGREFAACDAADMRVLFDWVQQNYPAKSVDMVFWSHATGWLRDDKNRLQQYSFGYDTNPGENSECSRMYIEELATTLQSLNVKPNRIMFDACFMQCVEVAYAMRNSADWIIASPAEIPGYGAPYEALVPLFFDATATPQNIIGAYKAEYDGANTGVVLSAVRCDAMQQLADATAIAVKKVIHSVSGSDCAHIFSYLPGGYLGRNKTFPNFFDMNSVMCKYLAATDYAMWKNALDAALPYRCANNKWYSSVLDSDGEITEEDYITVDKTWSGISMYLPNADSRFRNLNASFAQLEWYNAAAWNEIE